MGLYIDAPEMGSLGKSDILINNYGATITTPESEVGPDEVMVCVVNNGPFEAAGIITDDRELVSFDNPFDFRPKEWLVMDRSKAKELVGVDFDKY